MTKNLYQVIFCGNDSPVMEIPSIFTKHTSEHEMIWVPNQNLDKAIPQIYAENSPYGKIREEVESPGYMVDHYALKHSGDNNDALNIALIENFPLMQMLSTSKELLMEATRNLDLPFDAKKVHEIENRDTCSVFT